ncbi:FkbM family methyltransferase [uncultured Phascolarctobacterium sp.]|uniref:FkbM family methyltransferase n=1 Tax=uncultured Phascolarctobacterium sp. TaxID=512296 RepID=UPI0027D970B5|nr:FkbM family methyltransferase [uncultured Phascolarctobacterium sp.]
MSIINICHDFKYGKIIYNTRDRYIGRSLAAYGEYSQGEAELYKQLLRSGDTVIEVGANMGSLTVPLARFVGEAGRVIVFEPQRLIFQILAGNAAINSLTNIYAYNKGVGAKYGTIVIDDPKEFCPDFNTGGVKLTAVKAGYAVDIVTLDGLGIEQCSLLKIDCEGMERDVLEGGRALIGKCRPIIYMERSEGCLGLLREYSYQVYGHTVPLFMAK